MEGGVEVGMHAENRLVGNLLCMQGDHQGARAAAARVLQISVSIACTIAVLLLLSRFLLPRIFTRDPAVIKMAAQHLPIVALAVVIIWPPFVLHS